LLKAVSFSFSGVFPLREVTAGLVASRNFWTRRKAVL
jgi:hypothetical protein